MIRRDALDTHAALQRHAQELLDEVDIRAAPFDEKLHTLLTDTADFVMSQGAQVRQLQQLLVLARERGTRYLKQAVRNNEKYEELRKARENEAEADASSE